MSATTTHTGSNFKIVPILVAISGAALAWFGFFIPGYTVGCAGAILAVLDLAPLWDRNFLIYSAPGLVAMFLGSACLSYMGLNMPVDNELREPSLRFSVGLLVFLAGHCSSQRRQLLAQHRRVAAAAAAKKNKAA